MRTRVGRNPPGEPSFTEITRRSYHFKPGWAILCFRKLPLVAEGGGGLREDTRGLHRPWCPQPGPASQASSPNSTTTLHASQPLDLPLCRVLLPPPHLSPALITQRALAPCEVYSSSTAPHSPGRQNVHRPPPYPRPLILFQCVQLPCLTFSFAYSNASLATGNTLASPIVSHDPGLGRPRGQRVARVGSKEGKGQRTPSPRVTSALHSVPPI